MLRPNAYLEAVLWSETGQIETMKAAAAEVKEPMKMVNLDGKAATIELGTDP